MNWRYLVGAFALMMGLAACGEDGSKSEAAPSCEAGDTLCGTSCVDTGADPRHCGACGVACADGEVCSEGACTATCPAGQTLCEDGCFDLGSSRDHCGACGRTCAEGELCAANDCVAACPDGQTACDGGCFDLDASTQNCGACGTTCGTGEVCIDGACAANCPTGQVDCDGACINTATDGNHCGACGNTCAEGEACVDGSCATSCGEGLSNCDGACVDTDVDRANCGACGTTCGADELCIAGSCELSCAPGTTECDGACVDTDVDRANCGACGNSCGAEQICTDGACVASCGTWASDVCDGSCTNLQTDPGNCGTCGNACDAGEVCSEGACTEACAAGSDVCGGSCTDFDHDPNNCGGCGIVCAGGNNGAGVCSAGVCATVCLPNYGDCNLDAGTVNTDGCETPFLTAPDHCGGCGNACPTPPNGIAACVGGTCGLAQCAAGWDDCDLDASNGCEQQVTDDVDNCGACGVQCGAGQLCINSTCESPGLADICDTAYQLVPGVNSIVWSARGLDYFTAAPSCNTASTRGTDIVLRYTATATGAVKIDATKNASDRTHMVVSKAPCGNVTDEFRCVSDFSSTDLDVSFPVVAGETFHIYLAVSLTSYEIPNPLVVEVTEFPGVPAAGESCASPATLVDGANSIAFTANINDHFRVGPTCNSAPPVGPDIVLRYVPTYTGAAEFVVTKASGQAWYMLVDEATCGTPEEALTCSYAASAATELRSTIQVTQGTEYFVYLTAAGTTSSIGHTPIASPLTVQVNTLDCSGVTPAVSTVVPAENGQAAALDDSIVLTLNEPARTDAGQVTLTGTGGTSSTFTIPSPNVTFSADGKTVTIKPDGFFVAEEQVTVSVSGIRHLHCASTFPAKTWSFAVPPAVCNPGFDGMNGGRMTRIPIPAAGSFITEYFVAADTDPNGWVYTGGTSHLLRVRKDGSTYQNVTALASLGTAELGYDMLIDGQNIYVLEGKTSGTSGHFRRISSDGGATWEKTDMATFGTGTSDDPEDQLNSVALHGGTFFFLTRETTFTVNSQIWAFDKSAAVPATAQVIREFGANAYHYCNGLAVDNNSFFTTCRKGSATSSPYHIVRIDRTTGAITDLGDPVPGNTTAMALHAADKNGDGLADYLYFQEDVEEGYFVCSPYAATPWLSKLYSFGTGTGNYGLGFDPVSNVLWAVDDDTAEFVKIQ